MQLCSEQEVIVTACKLSDVDYHVYRWEQWINEIIDARKKGYCGNMISIGGLAQSADYIDVSEIAKFVARYRNICKDLGIIIHNFALVNSEDYHENRREHHFRADQVFIIKDPDADVNSIMSTIGAIREILK